MDTKEKLMKAKAALLLDQPFFATLALRLHYVPDNSIRTASTNGIQLRYNKDYIDCLSQDQIKGMLAHIVMHGALLHHTRRGKRDAAAWNKATDYAINPMLLSSGFVLPPGYLSEGAYKEMSAEQIYSMLPSQTTQEPEDPVKSQSESALDSPAAGKNDSGSAASQNPTDPGSEDRDESGSTDQDEEDTDEDEDIGDNPPDDDLADQDEPAPDEDDDNANNSGQDTDADPDPDPPRSQGGTGDVEDAPKDVDHQQLEAEMKEALVQAAIIAERQGKLPGYMKRAITELLRPRIDWRESLARFLTEVAYNDYTWTKPSPRYLYRRLYLPSLQSNDAGCVILFVDTSFSIDQDMLNQFAAEAQQITATFRIPLQIIYVDAEIQGVQDVDPDDTIELEAKGGGGTDFRPPFEYVEQNDLEPRAVVYLTDGECDDFPNLPDYPVLWAQFGEYPFNPPFGEVIQVQ